MIGATLVLIAAATAPAAPEPFAACARLAASRPDDWGPYGCFRLAARRHNRSAEAARWLGRLLERQPRNDWARLGLAAVLADRFQDGAEAHYREAAEGFAARGERPGEVRARVGLAVFLQGRGRLAEAGAELARARSAARDAGDEARAQAAVASAMQAYHGADYGGARRLLEEVKPRLFPGGPRELRAAWLGAMGTVLWAMAPAEEALECYRRQAELWREAGDPYEEATARGNVLFMRREVLGLPAPESVALAREILALARASGNRRLEGRAHYYLGLASTGPEQLSHARRFLALARETRQVGSVLLALRTLGSALATTRPQEAFRANGEAIALARRIGDLNEVARNRVVRAEMRWSTGPRAQAIADSRAALDAIEATRDLQPDGDVRAQRFARWGAVYGRLVRRLLAGELLPPGAAMGNEDLEEAFAAIERRRARVLLDEMDAAQASAALAPGGPAAARRREVLKALAAVRARLATAAAADGRGPLLAQVDRLEGEERELRRRLSGEDPRFATLRPTRMASLGELRESLAPDEALLSFFTKYWVDADPDSSSWVFVLTRESARVHRLGRVDGPALGLFLGLVERADGTESVGAARLYRDLLEGAVGGLPPAVRRLVLVVDEHLQNLPFDALREAGGRALADRYEITLAPSATLWLRLRARGALEDGARALVLADPARPSRALFEPLPHARREARAVARNLTVPSELRLGADASERFLKEADLRPFGLLHVAAHAVVDAQKPERTAVALAPGGPGEDGLLHVREVVGLDLRGTIVVLSSCRSASGAGVPGEGVMGLARAFFQAGARAVVGSLWPLRDDEAERFFAAFYRHLGAGRDVAASAAAARRERIRAGRPAASWAGLVVLGDGTAALRPRPGADDAASWPGMAAAAVAAGGLLALLARRRHAA